MAIEQNGIIRVKDLDDMFIIDERTKKISVNIPEGADSEFLQVTNLDTDVKGKGFKAFFGVINKAEGANVLNVPKMYNYGVMTTEKSSDASHYVTNNIRIVGYQITSRGNIEQRIAIGQHIWVRTNNGGTFNPAGELVTPNTDAWSEWVRDTTPKFMKFVTASNINIHQLEMTEGDNPLLRLKVEYDEDNGIIGRYNNFIGNRYTNAINSSEAGLYVGLNGAKKHRVVYVDNTSATSGTDETGSGTREDPYKSLHFLTQVLSHERTVVRLKGGTNKPYEMSNGAGRAADTTGVRIITTYGSEQYDTDLKSQENSTTFSPDNVHGFTDAPRATIVYRLDEVTGDAASSNGQKTLAQDFMGVMNNGVIIFENIDFKCDPVIQPGITFSGDKKANYSPIALGGGTVVFNYCTFNLEMAQDTGENDISIASARSGYEMRSTVVFTGCKVTMGTNFSRLRSGVKLPLLRLGIGDKVHITDTPIAQDKIPSKWSSRAFITGDMATNLRGRVIVQGISNEDFKAGRFGTGYSHFFYSNIPLVEEA